MINFNFNTQATKKNSSLNYVYKIKGIQCHSNHSLQQLELEKKKKKKKKKKGSIIYVWYNTFTQLNIPTQGLAS